MTTVAPNADKQTGANGATPPPGAGVPNGGGLASATTAPRDGGGTGNGGDDGAGDDGPGAGRGRASRRRGPLGLIRRAWDALWRGAEERELRAKRHALSDRQTADLERAFGVQRLAAAAIAAAADGRSRPDAALPAIIGLLRESATWSLSAATADPPPTTPAEALARTSPELLGQLLPDAAAREHVLSAFAEPAETWARRPSEEQERTFRELGAFSTALLRRLTFTRRRLRRILMRRTVISLAFGLLIFTGVEIALTMQLRPSLTAGKTWRASSALDICRPKDHYCADAVTDIFFCTTDENNPWVEYDLGDRKTFRQLVVENRKDCCPDRAVPLALEVSDDQKEWREVVRHNETFSTWRTSLPTTRARYVRLRVMRRSILHLDSFDLYR